MLKVSNKYKMIILWTQFPTRKGKIFGTVFFTTITAGYFVLLASLGYLVYLQVVKYFQGKIFSPTEIFGMGALAFGFFLIALAVIINFTEIFFNHLTTDGRYLYRSFNGLLPIKAEVSKVK